MKIKHFLFTLSLAIVGATHGWAADATFDFSQQGYENQQVITSGYIDSNNGTMWTADKGSGTVEPAYYEVGTALRVYGGGSLTISSNRSIAKIELTLDTSAKTSSEFEQSATQTPNATSFTFTRPTGSGHTRVQKIAITYGTSSVVSTRANTVYFYNTNNWNTVYCYTWTNGETDENAEWPGAQMTYLTDGYYEYTSTNGFAYCIFTNGLYQTSDLVANDECCYVYGDTWDCSFEIPTDDDDDDKMYSVSEIYDVYQSLNLSAGSKSSTTYTVQGYVTHWKSGYPNYQNADFFIDDTPDGSISLLECFRLTGSNDEDKRQLNVGDYVEATAYLQNYSGRFELVNGSYTVLSATATYTVTFYDWDEKILCETTVTEGSAAEYLCEEPWRDGYIFTGWDTDFSNVTNDLIVTAQYEVNPDANVFSSGICGDNLTWKLYKDGSLVIVGTGDMYDYSDIDYENFAPWEKQPEDKAYNIEVVSVSLPEGITSIGNNAFRGSLSIFTEITIPRTLKRIGDNAFRESVEKIHLTDIAAWCDMDLGIMDFLKHLYLNDVEITHLSIPNGVIQIKKGVFANCVNLSQVALPQGLEVLGNGCFQYCQSLVTIDLKEGLQSIGEYAFYGCSFTSIDIPQTVTTIGDGAFGGCQSLSTVDLKEGLQSIGEYAFYGCAFTSIDIPQTVTTIGDGAFGSCENLASIIIPDAVSSIEVDMFAECISLAEVVIGSGVSTIGENAFYRCTNLQTITVKTLTPPTVAFSNTFDGVNKAQCRLIVPSESYELYKNAPVWREFIIESSERYYTVTYLDWDGTLLHEESVLEGATAQYADVPSRAGYDFIGWSKDLQTVESNMYVVALYEEVKTGYTIVFVDDLSDEVIATRMVDLTIPDAPNHDEYNFVGWYVEQSDISNTMTVRAFYESTQPSGLPAANSTQKGVQKIVKNGQLYILLPNGTTYNLQGAEVRGSFESEVR